MDVTAINNTDVSKNHPHYSTHCTEASFWPLCEYSTERYPDSGHIIEKAVVHKARSMNVLIREPVILSRQRKIVRTSLLVHQNNPFFFDHKTNHIEGVIIIAALRQLGLSVTHQFLDVSLDSPFILHDLDINFLRPCHHEHKVYLDLQITGFDKLTKHSVKNITARAWVHQQGVLCAKSTANWSALPEKIARKIFAG